MDFFGAQTRARRQSRLLSFAFAACVTAVVLILNVVVLTALRIARAAGSNAEPMGESLLAWALAHPGAVVATTLLASGFIGAASLVRSWQLREGGGYVARSLGGVRVERDTPDPRRRQLHNVVEEMAIAAGMPVPEIYVLEDEEGINAFAAGHTPANAAIAVTRGALKHLNRDQLQGVIAHEFSHVLNGDMRLSMRLVGLVFGLMAVSLAGRMLVRVAARGRRQAVPVLAAGIAIATVGYAGYWAGRILQAWISRTRERLADASAVQFTRNPAGLRDALVRAAALGQRQQRTSSGMDEFAHMMFLPAAQRVLATHPPLQERVRALDPHMTPERLDAQVRQVRGQMQADQIAAPEVAPQRPQVIDTFPGAAAVPAAAALIAASTGDPDRQHLDRAIALHRAMPPQMRASAGNPEHAQALLLAVVIFSQAHDRQNQLRFVRERFGHAMLAAVEEMSVAAAALPPLLRLPAVLQLMPALRALSETERLGFSAGLRDLARLDGRLSVFEYALEKLAQRALVPRTALQEPHGPLSLADCSQALGVTFAVLARHGASSDADARRAYEAGMTRLLPRHRPAFNVIDNWAAALDPALDQLARLQAPAKQLLVEAMVRTIAHDDMLAPEEAELLRTLGAILQCPLPPLLPELATAD